MKDNFYPALQLVLLHEGGFSNHAKDPGGATMKGVTLAVFRRFFGDDKSVEALRSITGEQLAHIYRTGYWDVCQCDTLPAGVDYAVFDLAVNSGPSRATKFLRSITESGNALTQVELIRALCERRLMFLRRLPTFTTFGKGWVKRVDGVRAHAEAMANAVVLPPASAPEFETVRQGSTGVWVGKLQAALGVLADGKFGPGTDRALKAFQVSVGLRADGVAGRNTYRALGLIA